MDLVKEFEKEEQNSTLIVSDVSIPFEKVKLKK